MKILLMRHGASVGNLEGRMSGQSDDPLSTQGQHQVQRLAQRLWAERWQPSHLYASPLQRVLDTLVYLLHPWCESPVDRAWLAAHCPSDGHTEGVHPASLVLKGGDSLQMTLTPWLLEYHLGILTGLTWSEAKAQYPELCQALESHWDWLPIPEAETPRQGRARAEQFVRHLLSHHGDQDAIWVVAHGWILEQIVACLLGCDRTWKIPMPNTALFEFWLDRSRWDQTGMARLTSQLWQIRRFGDCQHLTPTPSSR